MLREPRSRWPRPVDNKGVSQLNATLSSDDIAVTFVNHATFLIQIGGIAILTDPIWSERLTVIKRKCRVGVPLENLPPLNEDAADGHQLYVPWWLYREQLEGKLGFARGYHIEFGGGKRMPGHGTASGLEWLTGGSYGAKFKQDVRRYYGSFVWFDGRGEMIPNDNSYCEIDPSVKDKWGIPVLRFHWKWSDHETRQVAHMPPNVPHSLAVLEDAEVVSTKGVIGGVGHRI